LLIEFYEFISPTLQAFAGETLPSSTQLRLVWKKRRFSKAEFRKNSSALRHIDKIEHLSRQVHHFAQDSNKTVQPTRLQQFLAPLGQWF
jgi:hypothetical protein